MLLSSLRRIEASASTSDWSSLPSASCCSAGSEATSMPDSFNAVRSATGVLLGRGYLLAGRRPTRDLCGSNRDSFLARREHRVGGALDAEDADAHGRAQDEHDDADCGQRAAGDAEDEADALPLRERGADDRAGELADGR